MSDFKARLMALLLFGVMLFGEVQNVSACEICTIPRLGRQENLVASGDPENKWFFEFLFEEQNWESRDPVEAHELHEDGHDVHNKTSEYFYHFTLGRILDENWTVFIEVPYVVRKSLGVEDEKVGSSDTSRGIGDLNMVTNYRIIKTEKSAVSVVGGVKFPTGEMDEADSAGDRFEPELQPGSGSYDFLLGGVFEHHLNRVVVKGNATYSFKNKGAQDFEFGDLFSTSLFIDLLLNPESEHFKTKAGFDVNYQFAQEDQQGGIDDPDSGGHTIFIGPSVTVETWKGASVFGSVLFPVLQDLGGVHQEMDLVWTLGGRLIF